MSRQSPSSQSSDATLPRLPHREPGSHKGSYGRALLIGGSREMPGALGLAGMATLRSGAGLVQLGAPRSAQPIVASYEPSYMTAALDEDADGRLAASARERLSSLAQSASAAALGPGLGRSADLDALVAWLFETLAIPLVIDADGLNAVADQPRLLELARQGTPGPRIFTPHPGEFARLTGRSTKEVQAARESLATDFAAEHGLVLVLKGKGTVVTDGRRTAVNATGNPGMATGGTGDVLTGVVAGLLCQGMPPWEAARLAVHVHGLAGDLAARHKGQVSLIARDLVEHLPAAFHSLESGGN